MRRDVFQAIADPTRRAIIDVVAQRQYVTLNGVADHFPISRPAISRHIRILTECGLIVIRQQGRERVCSVDLQQMKQVADWTAQYRSFWTQKLDALGAFLEKEEQPAPARKKSLTAKNKRS